MSFWNVIQTLPWTWVAPYLSVPDRGFSASSEGSVTLYCVTPRPMLLSIFPAKPTEQDARWSLCLCQCGSHLQQASITFSSFDLLARVVVGHRRRVVRTMARANVWKQREAIFEMFGERDLEREREMVVE